MTRKTFHSNDAPAAIGAYSQAVKAGNTVYLSGSIPLLPETMELVSEDVRTQIVQVFDNLEAVCIASGGSFDKVVKLTVFLTDLSDFPLVNEVMEERFSQPYPARAAIGVASLPRNVAVEVEGIMHLG
jgi:reactive intermediate/imine deaminase